MWQTNVWQQDVIRHTVEAVRTKDSRAVLGHLLAAVDKYFREIQHTVAEGQEPLWTYPREGPKPRSTITDTSNIDFFCIVGTNSRNRREKLGRNLDVISSRQAVLIAAEHSFWDDKGSYTFNVFEYCDEEGEFYFLPEESDFAVEMKDRVGRLIEDACETTGETQYLKTFMAESEGYVISRYEAYATQENSQGGLGDGNSGADNILPRVYGAAIFPPDQTWDSPQFTYELRFCYDSKSPYEANTDRLYGYIPFIEYSTPQEKYETNVETVMQAIIDLTFIQAQMDPGEEPFLPLTSGLANHRIKYSLSDYGLSVPEHSSNDLAIILESIMPTFAALSFVFVVPPLLKRIVHEKETGVKEFMRMMGLPGWLNWVSWFVSAAVTSVVTNVVIVALLAINFKYSAVLPYSNVFVVFLFFTFYSVALIFMMFAISTFFNNANLALAAGVIIHMLTYFWPYGMFTSTDDVYASMSLATKLSFCLLPNVGLYLGIISMLTQEQSTTGAQFNNLGEPISGDDQLTMGLVWTMFVVDAVIYGVIMWYVDNIKPGPYGQAKPVYFIFLPSYWCGSREAEVKELDKVQQSKVDPEVWEPEPEGTPGVQVRDLTKVFRSTTGRRTVHAVKGVRFSAFPDQIMALLGHNGAGKTTTMSILTGLFSATSGTAVINGYDINTNIEKVRGHLGLCPQHNMLFPSLTVREHLFFFGMLKGLPWSQAKTESVDIAEKVMLGAKKNKLSTTLSGGMKRKLHLGISIIGHSNVILLDEPTSGMDPEARREIWDLLQEFKMGRTLLLTTHFMEEADVLGDRIAIMADGSVKCYGTSLFLKTAYGSGYRLTMTKAADCRERAVKTFIRSHVPSAATVSNVSGELAMSLPNEDEEAFPQLLKELQEKKPSLGVDNFGLSVTTLEDVFLKVGAQHADDDDNGNQKNDVTSGHERTLLQRLGSIDSATYGAQELAEFQTGYASGAKLLLLQLKGLLSKRFVQTKRNWALYLLLGITPIALTLASNAILAAFDLAGEVVDTNVLVLTLGDYKESTNFVDINSTVLTDLDLVERFNDNMFKLMESSGTKVMRVSDTDDVILGSEDFTGIEGYGRQYIAASEVNEFNVVITETIVGEPDLSVSGIDFSGRFNVVPYHARPLVRNLVDTAILRTFTGDDNAAIITSYHPIIVTDYWLYQWQTEDVFVYPSVIVYSVMLSVGLMLFLAAFIIFPIRERLTNAKQVQIMAGVHPITFWVSNLLWDLSIFVIVSLITTVVMATTDRRELLNSNGAAFALFLTLFLFGVSGLLLAYVFTFVAKSAPSSFALFIIVGLVAGVVVPFIVWFLRQTAEDIVYTTDEDGNLVPKDNYDGPNLILISDVLRYIFTFVPFFPQARSLMAILQVQEENLKCENQVDFEDLLSLCQQIATDPGSAFASDDDNVLKSIGSCCTVDAVGEDYAVCGRSFWYDGFDGTRLIAQIDDCPEVQTFYSFEALTGINIDIIFLIGDAVLLLLILVGLDSGFLQRNFTEIKYKLQRKFSRGSDADFALEALLDEDVEVEQRLAKDAFSRRQDSNSAAALIVNDMSKSFGRFKAVKGLSFTVSQGECFGFLGVNGAGKTTSFRMLTGDEYMTTGRARLYHYDRHEHKRNFMRVIGYCPQFDSIIEVLTGREMLQLFAHIRGVPGELRDQEVNKWIDFVGLQKYADRQCGSYSGGNKRKLNVAQALVGDPPIIFLDEPSTGVDPAARRRLWDAIDNIKKRGQSVVLTSHSMEECEALCDRLAIMVNGQFRCLGGPQHLKNKFGQGFSVIIKLDRTLDDTSDKKEMVADFMAKRFQDCTIKDEHKDYLHFHIGDPSTPWHYLFQTILQAKSYFSFIQDYSLSETSLEEVFLFFAKNQSSSISSGEVDSTTD